MPNAKPRSRPLNHWPSAAVTATIIDSAPRPNTRRPSAISAKVPEAAVMTAPTRQIAVNASVAVRVPKRSTITPPMSTMMMFGAL
jgi:hypothetical protein